MQEPTTMKNLRLTITVIVLAGIGLFVQTILLNSLISSKLKEQEREVQKTVNNYITQSQAQATVIFPRETSTKDIEIDTITSKCSYGIISGQKCEDISDKLNKCLWFTVMNDGSAIYARCIKIKGT